MKFDVEILQKTTAFLWVTWWVWASAAVIAHAEYKRRKESRSAPKDKVRS
jgi:hypothetical protein